MILITSEPEATMRGHALALWAAARERAVDELAIRAARLSGEGRKDEAAGVRAAASRPAASCPPRASPSSGVLGRGGTQGLRTIAHLRPMKPSLDQC
jgi:hypothetical protein